MPFNRHGLPCPQCQAMPTRILRVQRTAEGHLWRRRECPKCGHRFTALQPAEVLELPGSVGWRHSQVSINWAPFRAHFARILTEAGAAFHPAES